MFGVLATVVDTVHALTMIAWVMGMPLLFVSRWPRARRVYAVYAVVFVVVSQASQWVLGECFFTTVARWFWESQPAGSAPADVGEWFTVRLARAIFGLAPSHRAIVWFSESAVVLTAVFALLSLRRERRHT